MNHQYCYTTKRRTQVPNPPITAYCQKIYLGDIFEPCHSYVNLDQKVCTQQNIPHSILRSIHVILRLSPNKTKRKCYFCRTHSKTFVPSSSGLSHILCIVFFTSIVFLLLIFLTLFFSKEFTSPASVYFIRLYYFYS